MIFKYMLKKVMRSKSVLVSVLKVKQNLNMDDKSCNIRPLLPC